MAAKGRWKMTQLFYCFGFGFLVGLIVLWIWATLCKAPAMADEVLEQAAYSQSMKDAEFEQTLQVILRPVGEADIAMGRDEWLHRYGDD